MKTQEKQFSNRNTEIHRGIGLPAAGRRSCESPRGAIHPEIPQRGIEGLSSSVLYWAIAKSFKPNQMRTGKIAYTTRAPIHYSPITTHQSRTSASPRIHVFCWTYAGLGICAGTFGFD